MKIGTDSVLLGAWADVGHARRVIDLGAGSGLLSMMVAQRNPDCSITAIEIDPDACLDARENFAAYPDEREFEVVNADAADYMPDEPADLIICNPPYFTSALKSPDAARATARHGAGLLPRTAIELAARWLSSDGLLAMVTPSDDASGLIFTAELNRLHPRRVCMVSQVARKAPTRILWEFSRQDGVCQKQTLAIRGRDGAYTRDYVDLTADFYLGLR